MGRIKRVHRCRVCGTLEKVNPRSDLCEECAYERVRESIRQLRQRSGPIYEKWREGLRRV